jgi:hypothetical protein
MMIRTVTLFGMDVGGIRRLGRPVTVNKKSGWFRIMKGAKTSFVIKRNYVKHNVRPVLDLVEEVSE